MRRLFVCGCLAALLASFAMPVGPIRAQGGITIPAGDVEALRTAINAASQTGQPATINLTEGSTYTFTIPDESQSSIGGILQDHQDLSTGPDALPLITTELTINGNGSTFKREGDEQIRFFTVFVSGRLTLNDLTLDGGNSAEEGGAIEVTTAGLPPGLTANHVTFIHNQTRTQGGALYSAGSAVLTDCVFTENQSEREGGAIYVGGGSLAVKGGSFDGNQATTGTSYGGAINADENTSLDIDGTTFSSNVAASGGAIAVNGQATIARAQFTANQSVARGQNDVGGGAIYVGNYAQLSLTESTLASNQSEKGGGALAVNEARQITVSTSVFANNIAAQSSGAGAIVFLTTNATESPTLANVNQNCFQNNTMQFGDKSVLEEVFVSESFGGIVTLDATNNWWGSPNGPTSEQRGLSPDRSDNLSAAFSYQPFLTVAPAICGGAIPTPAQIAVLPTATAEPDCLHYTGTDYKVAAPKGSLPAGATLTCAPSDNGLTLFALDKNSAPIQAFKPPLKVCLKAKSGSLQFLNLTTGAIAKIASTVEGEYLCAQVKSPGLLQLVG